APPGRPPRPGSGRRPTGPRSTRRGPGGSAWPAACPRPAPWGPPRAGRGRSGTGTGVYASARLLGGGWTLPNIPFILLPGVSPCGRPGAGAYPKGQELVKESCAMRTRIPFACALAAAAALAVTVAGPGPAAETKESTIIKVKGDALEFVCNQEVI